MAASNVIHHGMLYKRSPSSFMGVHPWQLRRFVLTPSSITYYKKSKMAGVLHLESIVAVDFWSRDSASEEDKAASTSISQLGLSSAARFYIRAANGRQFDLTADTLSSAHVWIDTITTAVTARKSRLSSRTLSVVHPGVVPSSPHSPSSFSADGIQLSPSHVSPDAASSVANVSPSHQPSPQSQSPSPLYASFLFKQSPTALVHIWQQRWFELFSDSIRYSKSPSASAALGHISLSSIVQVRSFPGARFDIAVTDGRIYILRASNTFDATSWIHHLCQCQPSICVSAASEIVPLSHRKPFIAPECADNERPLPEMLARTFRARSIMEPGLGSEQRSLDVASAFGPMKTSGPMISSSSLHDTMLPNRQQASTMRQRLCGVFDCCWPRKVQQKTLDTARYDDQDDDDDAMLDDMELSDAQLTQIVREVEKHQATRMQE